MESGFLFGKRLQLTMTFVVMLLIVALAAGCGSSSNKNNSAASSGTADEAGFRLLSDAKMDGPADAAEHLSFQADNVKVAVTSAPQAAASGESSVPPQLAEPGNTVLNALDRKLIYRANVTMEVEDYGKAQTELFNLVTMSSAYMLNFNDTETKYELGGVFVIKVPSSGFQSFLTQLEKLKFGDKFQRNVQGQDVTEEYVDLTSRLKAKQVVEERLLGFMEKATDTKNLLEFSNQLAKVQEDIETLKGRMRYIDQNVSFSTIELRMYQQLEKKEAVAEGRNAFLRAGSAMKGSLEAIVTFFEGLLIVLAGAFPILIVLTIIAIPIWLGYRKSRIWREDKLKVSKPSGSDSYATIVKTEAESNDPSDELNNK